MPLWYRFTRKRGLWTYLRIFQRCPLVPTCYGHPFEQLLHARVSSCLCPIKPHTPNTPRRTRLLLKTVQKNGFFCKFAGLLRGDARAPPTLALSFGFVWGVTKLLHRGSSRATPSLFNLTAATGRFNSPRGQCRKKSGRNWCFRTVL